MENLGKDTKLIGDGTIFIEDTVKIGKNVTIHPYNIIRGDTYIGNDVVLLSSNYIVDSNIGDETEIEFSHIEKSNVGKNSKIGPYSRLRPNSSIGNNVKIGNFVEVKNSSIGDGSKVSHLAYVGDADIGMNCNIGCGAIFVNYNGKTKTRTKVGNNCFIGSNVNIVAPVNVADGSYICAGSTLTIDTHSGDFVVARAREVVKSDYAKKYLSKKEDE